MSEDFDIQNNSIYKTLLESTRAIPWKIDWSTMEFAYIGPQIESLLGWSQESWVNAQDWAIRIHPQDRDQVVSFCLEQSRAGVDHEASYRALTPDHGYVWIRDVVHVLRDKHNQVEALIGFMFDISEHPNASVKLLTHHKALELTPRQKDVLNALSLGLPNKVIARNLDVSPNTVKVHLAELFRLLEVNTRTMAVVRARELGLIGDTATVHPAGHLKLVDLSR